MKLFLSHLGFYPSFCDKIYCAICCQSQAFPPPPKEISVCDLCINIVTDLDQWLTSEHTEADIVKWVEQVKLFLDTNFALLRAFIS